MSSAKILVTGAVSIVIQFGLAVAGWGGWSAFFAHPALRALAWVTVGLAALAVPSGGGLSTGEREDRSNRWVLGAFDDRVPVADSGFPVMLLNPMKP